MTDSHWPALVIGGGPAGAAAAIALARASVDVHLIERSTTYHDPVCGAFLGADSLACLHSLGIDPAALGAQSITRLRIISGTRVFELDLPFVASGLSRRALDEALINGAKSAGAVVTRGLAAQSACAASRSIRIKGGAIWSADALFLATGKHDLRNTPRPTSGDTANSVGLRASLPASAERAAALCGVIELHLFDEGYAGLLLLEDGTTNLCLSVSPGRIASAGSAPALLNELMRNAPLLRERVNSDLPGRFSAIAGVPYGWHGAETDPGVFRLGDQGAVIASLAGDGIAIALGSGQGAAAAYISEGPGAAQAWQRAWSDKCQRPLALAEALRRTAESPMLRSAGLLVIRLFPGLAARAASMTRNGAVA